MKGNATKTLTLILLILAFLIAFLFGIVLVHFIISINFIVPIAIISVFFIILVLFAVHYLRCYLHLANIHSIKPNKIESIKRINVLLIAILGFVAFSFTSVLLVSIIVYKACFDFQWYFLSVVIISSLYALNLAILQKHISI